MKILAVADRPPRKPFREILAENPVDLIITLGDLNMFDIQELETITEVPKIGVYGNHCSGNYFKKLGIRNMHLTTWEHQGILFGGFEGSVRYKPGDAPMYTQEQAQKLLKDFSRVDVMLTHCPPHGINDEPNDITHQGFRALNTYLDEKKPKCLLHGHTYPKAKKYVDQYKETKIVYVYEDVLIDINKK